LAINVPANLVLKRMTQKIQSNDHFIEKSGFTGRHAILGS
jgi:hypothetical protein